MPNLPNQGPTQPQGPSDGRTYQAVLLDEDKVEIRPLPEQGMLTIGRLVDQCEVIIDNPTLSRRHARIIIEPGPRFLIEDLNSQNGVTIGGSRIPPNSRVPLAPNMLVELGSVTLVIQRRGTPAASMKATSWASGVQPILFSSSMLTDPDSVLRRVAESRRSVLIQGETGVGKEVLATAIHRLSRRADKEFVRLNCANLPVSLMESELFGHERGAFSGADRAKPGLLETADHGTIFLDEIGELSIEAQAKLLRFLAEGEVLRLGALKPRILDVRVIAATNRPLIGAASKGRFREDLYYRLATLLFYVPPLRERRDDILPLAEHFIAEIAREERITPAPVLSAAARTALLTYRWPGNIRELRSLIERALTVHREAEITPAALGLSASAGPTALAPVAGPEPAFHNGEPPASERRSEGPRFSREQIVVALAERGGNQKAAAVLLGINRKQLIRYLDEYSIPRPKKHLVSGSESSKERARGEEGDED